MLACCHGKRVLPSSAFLDPDGLVVGLTGPAFAPGSGLIRQIVTQTLCMHSHLPRCFFGKL